MISQESIISLEQTWNRLGENNRIKFYEHLKSQCFSYGCCSDTPDVFMVMLADNEEWWKERLNREGIKV